MPRFKQPLQGLSRLSDRAGAGANEGGLTLLLESRSNSTWIVPVDGLYSIELIGGGASGGVYTAGGVLGPGGGAGGRAVKIIPLDGGAQYAITIGAGGPKRSPAGQGRGNNGLASSIVGPGVNMFADGGTGGGTAGAETGGAGGGASGGDVNFAGRGGNNRTEQGYGGGARYSDLMPAVGGGAGAPGDGGSGGNTIAATDVGQSGLVRIYRIG